MAGRARAALAAKNNPQLLDRSWMIHKACDYCGYSMVVNNYEDRKPRTPKFMGLVICPRCDPRHFDDRRLWRDGVSGTKPRIAHPILYRTAISVYLVRMMATGRYRAEKIFDKASQFFAEDGSLKPLPEPNRDQIRSEFYG